MLKTIGMKILLLDNYDSFTFNLYHLVEQFDVEIEVRRNNEIALEEVNKRVLIPMVGTSDIFVALG